MPRISFFFGVSIYMYPTDHAAPHFHARHGGDEATFAIATGLLIDGRLPRSSVRLVKEWWRRYKRDLEVNWLRTSSGLRPRPIPPLD